MLHQGKEVTVIRPAEEGDIGYHPKAGPQFMVMDEDEVRRVVPEYVEPVKAEAAKPAKEAEPVPVEFEISKAPHRNVEITRKPAPVNRSPTTSPGKTRAKK